MNFDSTIDDWLNKLAATVEPLSISGSLGVKGFQLDVASTEPEYYNWLKLYLAPMLDTGMAGHASTHFRLNCINANELIVQLMQLTETHDMEYNSVKVGRRRLERIHLNSDITIDIYRRDGIAWLSNSANNQLTLLLSSRVNWPALEVSSTARAMIIGYLRQQGWHLLHSGAVRIDEKNYLVIGDEGQGKTSLLLALMAAGCDYISNERLFVRQVGKHIEALSFPMPVAIGMGTAQQYPQVMHYVYYPEFCLYPHRRMDIRKLRSTDESEWSSLSDKVQLLIPELVSAFAGNNAWQGGQLEGVIVPSMQWDTGADFQDKAVPMDKPSMHEIVDRNYIPYRYGSRYTSWLPLGFEPGPAMESEDELIESISGLPGLRFDFIASKEREQAVSCYPEIIKRAILTHPQYRHQE